MKNKKVDCNIANFFVLLHYTFSIIDKCEKSMTKLKIIILFIIPKLFALASLVIINSVLANQIIVII